MNIDAHADVLANLGEHYKGQSDVTKADAGIIVDTLHNMVEGAGIPGIADVLIVTADGVFSAHAGKCGAADGHIGTEGTIKVEDNRKNRAGRSAGAAPEDGTNEAEPDVTDDGFEAFLSNRKHEVFRLPVSEDVAQVLAELSFARWGHMHPQGIMALPQEMEMSAIQFVRAYLSAAAASDDWVSIPALVADAFACAVVASKSVYDTTKLIPFFSELYPYSKLSVALLLSFAAFVRENAKRDIVANREIYNAWQSFCNETGTDKAA